jgi:hypothetical protein
VPTASTFRLIVALLALTAGIALATVAAVPGHDHSNLAAHHCAVCQAGLLPCLTPSVVVTLRAPDRITWDVADPVIGHSFDPRRVTTSPRAPPA